MRGEGTTEAPAAWRNDRYPWVELFGIRVNALDLDGLLQALDARIAARDPGYVVTPNVDHVCNFRQDPALAEAYRASALVVADSTPLMWAARLLGTPLPQKLSGSDLIYWVSGHAARQGHSIFLLGAAEGVADKAAANLMQRYPGLRVAGTCSPPMGFEKDAAELARIRELVESSGAEICFAAFGSPKQEVWMHRSAAGMATPVLIGVGASLDFVAGRVRRAPRVVQRCGLEWLWRLCREPGRLWRRYLVNDSRFIGLFVAEWWRKRRCGSGRGDRKDPCSEDTCI